LTVIGSDESDPVIPVCHWLLCSSQGPRRSDPARSGPLRCRRTAAAGAGRSLKAQQHAAPSRRSRSSSCGACQARSTFPRPAAGACGARSSREARGPAGPACGCARCRGTP